MKRNQLFFTLLIVTLPVLVVCRASNQDAAPIGSASPTIGFTPVSPAGPSTLTPAPTATAVPPTLTPTPTTTAVPPTPALVAPATIVTDKTPAPVSQEPMVITNAVTNVRLGPGLAYQVSHILSAGATAPLLGRNDAGDWWAVPGPGDGPGPVGWVSGAVVTVQGDVSSAPILSAPPLTPDVPVRWVGSTATRWI